MRGNVADPVKMSTARKTRSAGWMFSAAAGIGGRVVLQILLLGMCSIAAAVAFRRALPRALANPCGFPSAPWGWQEALLSGGFVALFLVMSSGGDTAPKIDLGDVLTGVALYVGLVFFVLGFLVSRGFDLAGTFGLRVRGWSLATLAGWLLMFLPVIYLTQVLVYAWAGPDTRPQPIVDFLLQSPGWREQAAVLLVAVVAAPVTEELIFRGCLYGVLRSRWGRPAGILVSSALFAAIHGHAPSLPGLMILAAGLALVYERCGSLWAPIGMHAAFNGLTISAALLWPGLGK